MATVVIIDDNETIREGLSHTVRKMGHVVWSASRGVTGLELLKTHAPVDLVISDLKMEGMDGVEVLRKVTEFDPLIPTVIMTAYGSVETAVEAMKIGAFDFITKPFAPAEARLKVESALKLASARRANSRLSAQNEYLRDESLGRYRFAELIGASEGMQNVFRRVEKIAATQSTVLLQGESGTGKELVARAIHDLSARRDAPFIKINCGAITESLLESELFGHEEGAFTGAIKTKLGRFELADGGTLFLDEIGDVPASMQVKLLRALQEQEFERVGGETTLKVDVRIVSATHKDLNLEVSEGRFREDLFYRLHVVPLRLPPLRERREDVALLVEHFIEKISAKMPSAVRGISDEALARLMAYEWPGNVRELENAIEQSLVFASGDTIQVDALPAMFRDSGGSSELKVASELSLPEVLEDLEKQLIVKAFTRAEGVKTETAKLLGIKTSALYYKLEKYEIG